jgi:hypothetical protein
MNICRLNRRSKVCMKNGPARHTRTPPSSLPEPNTFFQRILSRRDSIPEPILDWKRELENKMKVRELAKKNRREGVRYSFSLYPGAQLEFYPYSIYFYYYLINIVAALPAMPRIAAEHNFL